MRRNILLDAPFLLPLVALALAVAIGPIVHAAVTDNGNGTATVSFTAPAHTALDAAVGLGYLRATCTLDLVTAGVCLVADGSPLPTVTATQQMVNSGRVRAALLGQTIPNLAAAAAFLDYRVRMVLKGYRDQGREEMQKRSITPVDLSDPLEAQ